MAKLLLDSLKDKKLWSDMAIELPDFDIKAVKENTIKTPEWIHFGAGNIFRGFIAAAAQDLLNKGEMKTGLIAVDTFDFEVISGIYKPFDDLSVLVTMEANGGYKKKVIGSIVESIAADRADSQAFDRLNTIFEADSLKVVSFTITEKGYGIKNNAGQYLGIIKQDIEKGPGFTVHTMSMIAELMYKRYKKGGAPLTLASMDNCSHNGDKLKEAVICIAREWVAKGHVEAAFVDYLESEKSVTYPLSMIDKITPRPSEKVENILIEAGLEDMSPIVTSKNSYMAPFVNAEVCEYLVIEDKFAGGRPNFEAAGIMLTDRDTVNNVETMKVTTCLNPLHTALAVSGCLLGYTSIADQMKDKQLVKLIHTIGYTEGLKVVVDPGIIEPKAFIDEVINERFSNPNIPDTPQRIATDTSQKIAIRFGETIKKYVADTSLDQKDLVGIPMAIALWCRYLIRVDDNGVEMALSSDPLEDDLRAIVGEINFGETADNNLEALLSNKSICGQDLYQVGLGKKIEGYFNELNAGVGAIRKTLIKYFGE